MADEYQVLNDDQELAGIEEAMALPIDDSLFIASGCETDEEYDRIAERAYEAYELHRKLTGGTVRAWLEMPIYRRLKWIRAAQLIEEYAEIQWSTKLFYSVHHAVHDLVYGSPEEVESARNTLRGKAFQLSGKSWAEVAAMTYQRAVGSVDSQPHPNDVVLFEAIVRHMVNRFECDKTGERHDELNHDWAAWIEEKLQDE